MHLESAHVVRVTYHFAPLKRETVVSGSLYELILHFFAVGGASYVRYEMAVVSFSSILLFSLLSGETTYVSRTGC